MKRKLISFDVFENIKNKSLSAAEKELVEAAPILSKALAVEGLELLCYGPEDAVYETLNGEYVHTNYAFENGAIKFENIEQLAIDQDTEKTKSRQALSLLVDSLLDEEKGEDEAKVHFETYMNLPLTRRTLREGFDFKDKKKNKHKASMSKCMKCKKGGKKKFDGEKDFGRKFATKSSKKELKEWFTIAGNVLDYVNFREMGPTLQEAEVSKDKMSNVSGVKFGNSASRNAAKMLSFNWNTIDTDYKILRGSAKRMAEDMEFCKAVSELKRHNALSDNSAMSEAVEGIVAKWPGVLMLTQDEMSITVKMALETVKASNYDDDTCTFLAEGILRAAHNIYTDKVQKLIALSGATIKGDAEDQYIEFKNVADNFYPHLDESARTEMQMYADLYEALREVYATACQSNDETIKVETASHLNELLAIVQHQVTPDIQIAEQAAEWLQYLTEATLTAWEVSNKAYTTLNGDVPGLAEKATKNPTLSSLGNEYGDVAPVSDGKNWSKALADEMRNNSWGNIAGADIWPSLDNPYIPKPFGDWTMKGEKGVDNDLSSTLDTNKASTWPALQNPNSMPSPDIFKMKE